VPQLLRSQSRCAAKRKLHLQRVHSSASIEYAGVPYSRDLRFKRTRYQGLRTRSPTLIGTVSFRISA
jgi:hypothetical protein